ncbi:hypothetical protein [Paenarthrobacter sp. YJN-5]|uniref:hypothetical protein n=1 Tax=Paenarthrobacter sp. YJN-5 TaxID=2735316 RepID=UPI0018786818|nr:hypothetical protein [Paenarthrobacter sp. YJN-5]QOT16499.1 hypothetical protein HMI59_07700 [Paenarthrobacter sp. YJN-5]
MTKKPLELTIFAPVPEQPTAARAALTEKILAFGAHMAWHADRTREHILSRKKRLADTELAAEFWHASQVATYARARIDWGMDSWFGTSADRAEDIEHVLQRFAELPHFDEEES